MEDLNRHRTLFEALFPHLDERQKRLLAAAEAQKFGYGGVTFISKASGLSRPTITKGLQELSDGPLSSVRKPGAGRPRLEKLNPGLIGALSSLLEDSTAGDPERVLLWTCKSTRVLAAELTDQGYPIGRNKVHQLLLEQGYSLQGNVKCIENADHIDRDAQFQFINDKAKFYISNNYPVISVDTKKKELVGNYYNKGTIWKKINMPTKVLGHDFPDPSIQRAFPYGIYDVGLNTGYVNVGTDHDTGEFAVSSIRGWWYNEGSIKYPGIRNILITADGGGSNGYRLRLWKYELQKFCNEFDLEVQVCHFPAGTSKWNKIEHRLFSFISSNWRGQPLYDYETIVNLISSTKTSKGLSVTCRLDRSKYEKGIKITDEQMNKINILRSDFHGEWNYKILSNHA